MSIEPPSKSEQRSGLRAALVVGVFVVTALLAVAAANAFSVNSLLAPPPEVAEMQTPETRRWNATRDAVEYEHMYSKGVRAPSFDHMYAKPRARRY